MRKKSCIVLIWLLTVLCSLPVIATEQNMHYNFEVLVDGTDELVTNTGDIVTLVLKLKRTDADKPYRMYAMQTEIHYDGTFLEVIEDSIIVPPGVVFHDIAMVDEYRELYINYLSIRGGDTWDSNMVIGTVSFRVIGTSGVTQITNRDYLVSLPDGSGGYQCTTNDVTLVVSTACTVRFMSNGGTDIPSQIVQYGEMIEMPPQPVREGYFFDGWYRDIDLTEIWDCETDAVRSNMTLYAKWVRDTGDPEPQRDTGKHEWCWLIILLLILALILTIGRYSCRIHRARYRR